MTKEDTSEASRSVGRETDQAPGDQAHAHRGRPKLVSVIIPALNAETTIRDQLAALAEQTYDGEWEVIVADNGSVDRTREITRSFAETRPSWAVVDASAKRGPAFARNRGAEVAAGDLLLFCDADDIVHLDWVAEMVEAAKRADMIGGSLLVDDLVAQRPQAHGWQSARDRNALPTALDFLPYIPAGNLGVWTSVFHALGGWDEALTQGGEDVALSWNAQLRGHALTFAPNAAVSFRPPDSLRGVFHQFHRNGLAGALLYRSFAWAGAKRRPLRRAAKSWLWLLSHSPDVLLSSRRRGQWIRAAAQLLGRLEGSYRHRVLFL